MGSWDSLPRERLLGWKLRCLASRWGTVGIRALSPVCMDVASSCSLGLMSAPAHNGQYWSVFHHRSKIPEADYSIKKRGLFRFTVLEDKLRGPLLEGVLAGRALRQGIQGERQGSVPVRVSSIQEHPITGAPLC